MSIITMIGAGQMASALSFPLRENGHEVRLVGTPLDREIIEELRKSRYHLNLKRTLPEGIRAYQIGEVYEALENADVVVNGVSSFGLDWFSEEMLPVLPEHVPLLSITKGLMDTEEGGLIPYPYLLEERLPAGKKLDINAVGGPCTSYELADRDDSHVAFCGRNMETLRYLKGIFACPYYHVSLSTDVKGVECEVALKNAYALGVTLAVGLSEKRDQKIGAIHYNSQAALFGQSLREMKELIAFLGGGEENLIFGGGDLYVTIYGGRTRKLGTLLGRGLKIEEALQELSGVTLESVVVARRTARAVRRLSEQGKLCLSDFPLLMYVDALLQGKEAGEIPWESFTMTVGG